MYKVGLTGNYYSGQYEVARHFEEYDVKVFDANTIVKFILNYSPVHINKIKSYFGDDIYNMGLLTLNRFNDNSKINQLLDLVEFDMLKAYEKFRIKYKNEFYTIFYYDFIFERNLDKYIDFKINCYRPKKERTLDMKYLTNYTDLQISKILDNELNDKVKKAKSDFIIQNYNINGDYQSDIVVGLESQIKKVHKQIMSRKSIDTVKSHYSDELYL